MTLITALLVAIGILGGTAGPVKAPERSAEIVIPNEKLLNTQPWWHNCP